MATILGAIGGIGSGISASSMLGLAGSIFGGLVQAAGIRQQAAADAAQAAQQARSMKKKGDEEFAIGQRKMIERKKETELVVSRQRAIAAASGSGATDQSTEAIMGKTQLRGEYAAMLDMYNGVVARNDLYTAARDTVTSGLNALKAGRMKAFSTIYGNILG
jgi:hypothetical protein